MGGALFEATNASGGLYFFKKLRNDLVIAGFFSIKSPAEILLFEIIAGLFFLNL